MTEEISAMPAYPGDTLAGRSPGDDNLQDWFAGYWPALFANKPQPSIDAVRELAGDRALYWYIRCQASDVVVDAAMRAGPAPLDQVLDWLAACIADETEDWDYRISAATALLDFPRGRHRALLDDLAARQGGHNATTTLLPPEQGNIHMRP